MQLHLMKVNHGRDNSRQTLLLTQKLCNYHKFPANPEKHGNIQNCNSVAPRLTTIGL